MVTAEIKFCSVAPGPGVWSEIREFPCWIHKKNLLEKTQPTPSNRSSISMFSKALAFL